MSFDSESFKLTAEGVEAFIKGFAILAAGGLFLWKREWCSRIQLQICVETFGYANGSLIVEPVCIVENKGLLRCYVHRLKMSVRFLKPEDVLKAGGKEITGATEFPHKALTTDVVQNEWEWSYVEAGIKQRYSHVTHIPQESVAVLVWVKLFHTKKLNDFYTAQKAYLIQNGKLQETQSIAANKEDTLDRKAVK